MSNISELLKIKDKMIINENFVLITHNKSNNGCGVASFINNDPSLIRVYEGAKDGSDDKTITLEEFINNYTYELKEDEGAICE